MKRLYFFMALCVGLSKHQLIDWENKINKPLRFFLCGFTGYLAFSTFSQLKMVSGHEDEFILLFFQGPGPALLAAMAIYLAFFALLLSIISASLFKSLLLQGHSTNGTT